MKQDEILCEYGSVETVRFLDPVKCYVYYSNGDPVLCKCGKHATSYIMVKEAYIARCDDCGFDKT